MIIPFSILLAITPLRTCPEVDYNATGTFRKFPEPALIPWPIQISARAAYTTLNSHTAVVVVPVPATGTGDKGRQQQSLRLLAELLINETAAVTAGGLQLQMASPGHQQPANGSSGGSVVIVLSLNQQDYWPVKLQRRRC